MVEYALSAINGGLIQKNGETGNTVLKLYTLNEYKENKEKFPHTREAFHELGAIRCCNAQKFRDCIAGTVRVPQKSSSGEARLTFGFSLNRDQLMIIENTGDMKKWIDKHSGNIPENASPDRILLYILEELTEGDILYLSHMEQETENTEDLLTESIPDDFYGELSKKRRKLSELDVYYAQLASISDSIASADAFVKNPELWSSLASRCDRLHEYVHLLRENILELRELCRNLQNAQQNRIMGILTIVTTVFLPLTLLTGWYGMNFINMPELHWKYGYAVIIAAAIIISCAEIAYFKKKKWF